MAAPNAEIRFHSYEEIVVGNIILSENMDRNACAVKTTAIEYLKENFEIEASAKEINVEWPKGVKTFDQFNGLNPERQYVMVTQGKDLVGKILNKISKNSGSISILTAMSIKSEIKDLLESTDVMDKNLKHQAEEINNFRDVIDKNLKHQAKEINNLRGKLQRLQTKWTYILRESKYGIYSHL